MERGKVVLEVPLFDNITDLLVWASQYAKNIEDQTIEFDKEGERGLVKLGQILKANFLSDLPAIIRQQEAEGMEVHPKVMVVIEELALEAENGLSSGEFNGMPRSLPDENNESPAQIL